MTNQPDPELKMIIKQSPKVRGTYLLPETYVTGRWRAQLATGTKLFVIGRFEAQSDAADAYDNAAFYCAIADGRKTLTLNHADRYDGTSPLPPETIRTLQILSAREAAGFYAPPVTLNPLALPAKELALRVSLWMLENYGILMNEVDRRRLAEAFL